MVYDSAAVSSELHDPATAVLYYRPRLAAAAEYGGVDPVNVRTALAGQLAGALTFTSSCFGAVKRLRLRRTCVAVSTQGRFVLMVCGHNASWAEARLDTLATQVNAATGGLLQLWQDCGRDRDSFSLRLESLLDSLVDVAFADVSFNDAVATSGSVASSATPTVLSPFSDFSNTSSAGASPRFSVRNGVVADKKIRDDQPLQSAEERLHTLLDVAPSLQMAKVFVHLAEVLVHLTKIFVHLAKVLVHLAKVFVHLAKSGMCGVFLEGQRCVEACVQQRGVLAGLTLHRHRVLSSQVEGDLTRLVSSLVTSLHHARPPSSASSGWQSPEADSLEAPPEPLPPSGALQPLPVDYPLPHGVMLHGLHVKQHQYRTMLQHQQQFLNARFRERNRGSLRSETASVDLTSLRKVLLEHQTLHSYPATLPGLQDHYDHYSISQSSNLLSMNNNDASMSSLVPPTLDPLQLCAKISKNQDLLNGDGRPSQSLPGTPRKIRVATMLPDVGNNSPDLRYKVLNAKRNHKLGGVSSSATPYRSNHNRSLPRKQYTVSGSESPYPPYSSDYCDSYENDGENYSRSPPVSGVSTLPRKTSKLSPPSLSLSYASDKDNKYCTSYSGHQDPNGLDYEQHKFSHKNGSKSRFSVKSGDSGFEEMAKGDLEMNLKNTKNKLNLQFAPDKIHRPEAIEDSSSDASSGKCDRKITKEINGNLKKKDSSVTISSDAKAKLFEKVNKFDEDDDSSRSESEISVLELSSFIDLKENDKELDFDVGDEKDDEDSGEQSSCDKDAHSQVKVVVSDPGKASDSKTFDGPESETDASPDDAPDSPSAGYRRVCLYTHSLDDSCLCLLLDEEAAKDARVVYSLWGIGQSSLPSLSSHLQRSMEVSKSSEQNVVGGDAFVRRFGQTLSVVDAEALDLNTISNALKHVSRRPEVLELTLRQQKCTVWCHRLGSSLTLYQHSGGCRAGPPIPSDPMAKLPYRARRRLEKDHAITLL
ncbi:hypothetical protein FHG87_008831 [Trinorchestia longiramus]|nr:hypothetical protein FHG87_008831 [Trinorchestia longiramus]